ncbi:MAG: lysine--tRNA ligase [Actinomycetota bacterium]|jgi:lysyl-tRNA synthetase class 2|nr:lysine--tRNA ligase [Acidimicrobiaceae bacterium]MEC9033987.1 lysine--tRNA ligase [Actinomycetota bacterium]MEE2645990.1 lysine--tRNA ligase [Actinomycetota bacterium]|tara:strand:+ start:2274 stop:3695 length:1422 start_codon:yes stop_codon:yes gene_type:complete
MAESTIPYRFDPSHSIDEIRETHSDIEDGSETGIKVVVAGRLMLKRDQGKIVFGTLQDSTGRIQLFAPEKTTPNFTELTNLHLGDWLGVTGEIIKTRKGELSVKVSEWVRLAEARRPFPDKWHGISDTDMRYRQRYVDLWVTEETRQTFLIRSRVISLTRRWLEERGFIEVETPVFHPIPGGALARPFTTHHNALDVDLYLRIAPELYLKRLVVGGFEKVYEIARVFRNEGLSTRHNPEFTMLELYQAYADYTDIMEMVENLMEYLALEILGTTTLTHGDRSFDLKAPWRRASMLELLSEYASIEVDLNTPRSELIELCDQHEVPIKDHYGPGKIILELYEKTVEPKLWDPIFVTDYPKEVSPLSRDHREDSGWVERFEAIVAGRELCNAFTELIDPEEQRSRFLGQEEEKAAGDEEAMVVDEDYLRSLEYGLPPTAGIGIGIDRLVMLLTGDTAIRDVILFPTLRPEQGLSD